MRSTSTLRRRDRSWRLNSRQTTRSGCRFRAPRAVYRWLQTACLCLTQIRTGHSRVNQFSIGFQREITPNLVVEASYVANRAVWLGALPAEVALWVIFSSQTSPQTYAQYGLYPYPGTGPCSSGGGGVCASTTYNNNNNDRNLLTQPLGSAAVQSALAAHGFPNFSPYPKFPSGSSLQSALYPFPQFGNITVSGSPTGNSKYDSLQIKATKRLSHGLQKPPGAFTWGPAAFNRATPAGFLQPGELPYGHCTELSLRVR